MSMLWPMFLSFNTNKLTVCNFQAGALQNAVYFNQGLIPEANAGNAYNNNLFKTLFWKSRNWATVF